MLSNYLPILIVAIGATLLGVGVLFLSYLLGPRRPSPAKNDPYECGILPAEPARGRLPVKFYLVAMLFIVFDLEVIFLYPWAVAYRELLSFGWFALMEMAVFVGILLLGYVYVWRKGAFEW